MISSLLVRTLLPRLSVFVALVILSSCSSPFPDRQAGPKPSTSIALTPLTPKGTVRWPFEFSWSGTGAPGCIYRVRVADAADRHLIDFETRETHVAAPAELRPMLGGSQPFYWHVSVEGSRVSSPPTEFRVR